MKTNKGKRPIKVIFYLLFLAFLGCSNQEDREMAEAVSQGKNKNFTLALHHYEQLARKTQNKDILLKAVREAAKISLFELKKYQKAIDYYQLIILNSENPVERQWAQRQIATINFDNLQNYQRAITEFNKLLLLPHTDEEEAQFRMNISRSYYYLNAFDQALGEIEVVLKKKYDKSTQFDAKMLYGNIFLAKKKFKEATAIFNFLLQDYEDRAIKENVALMLAVCYEENDDYKLAIQILEKYKSRMSQPDYVELRIKRLKERQNNAPGAKGYRK